MSTKATKMNDHLFAKLNRLYNDRLTNNVTYGGYNNALLFHKVTEAALVAEIERRGGK